MSDIKNPMSDSKEPDILKKSANYRVGKAIMSSIVSSNKQTPINGEPQQPF